MINQLIIYLKKFCTRASYYVLFSALLLVTPAQSHQPEIQSTPGDTIRYSTSNNEIRTVIVDNYFPYTFVNEQGEPDGLSVELIKAVAKELGMDCRVEVNTWSRSLDMLQAGEVNALSIMAYSEKRDKNYDFSAPYTIAFDAYFTRKNSPKILTSMDLKEKKIIVNKKDQAHDYLKTLPFITQDHFIYESNTAEALKILSSGKGDIAVMPKVLGLVLIKKLKIENLVLDPPIIQDYERPFSFAVKEGNLELLERLENGLQIIKETGEYQKIHNKWLGAYDHHEISFAEILKNFFWFILAFILISGVLLLWTVMLRRQVALRTKHLEKEITERKQAEEALEKERETLSTILENNPHGIAMLDNDDNYLYINPYFTKITGYVLSDIPNKNNWFDKVYPDKAYRKETTDAWKKDIHHEEMGKDREFKIRCKNGQSKYIEFRSSFLKDKTISVLTDITERKQAEKNLRESEARQGKMVANIGDVIAIIDQDGINRYKSPNIEKLFGWKPEDVVGASTWDIIHPDDIESTQKFFEKILNEPEAVGTMECRYRCKDGSYKWIEFTGTNFLHDSDINGLLGNYHDITKRKNMETQLQQAQKMESIGTLAGGIAHDFNNILFPIIGHSEMLIDDVSEDSPFRESLNEINTAALRAKDLVKQILTFSRQDNSELNLMKMQPIIKEALKLIRSTIPTTIEIIQDIQPACRAIKADPTQIHQIIMNLATNAYHAMEETGGELKVSLKQVELGEYDIITPDMTPGVYACLIVADTGVGMDKNLTDKIFDPFFTTKEKGKGTGMGLSVVHGIVKGMNGAIQVHSNPDKGTEFKVYFPIEKNSFEEQVTNSKAKIQGGTEHILLVDDEKAILTMEKLALNRLGYQVTSRTSSIEALEAFRANPDKFDLIITDMAMPNMSGDKLSVELTKIRPDIPVLLCTGFSETMSEEKAVSLGIKGFLLKPIIMKNLAQKVREVLDECKI